MTELYECERFWINKLWNSWTINEVYTTLSFPDYITYILYLRKTAKNYFKSVTNTRLIETDYMQFIFMNGLRVWNECNHDFEMQTSQDYIFHILQCFATKLHHVTHPNEYT